MTSTTAIARDTYLRFSNLEGARHIASEFALNKLLEVTGLFRTRSILEIGLGIGTIVHVLLENRPLVRDYYGTETHDFCREQLRLNLSEESYERLALMSDISELKEQPIRFDLVIVDGKSSDLMQLKPYLTKHALIAIEGDRQPQVDRLLDIFPAARIVNAVSFRKNHEAGVHHGKDWQGGIRFILINPTLQQNLYYFKEKVRSKMAYTYRRLINRQERP